jgi:hypothetical protein
MFNRQKLAKLLWKRTDDPLGTALLCALMYKNLIVYCQESYLKSQVEKVQKDFAKAAIGVLDSSFKSNDPRSYSILTVKHAEWNNCTVLELAYNAKNLDFIAHPCCQKMLTKRLFGSIQIRDIENGLLDFPPWVKCILSAFLIFPMNYWIVFPMHEVKTDDKKQQKKSKISCSGRRIKRQQQQLNETVDLILEGQGDEDDSDEEKEDETSKAELNKKLIAEMKRHNRRTPCTLFSKKYQRQVNQELRRRLGIANKNPVNTEEDDSDTPVPAQEANCKYVEPSLLSKVQMVWSSPFTKFWMNFISYVCFLVLFGMVTLWPGCGNLILDSALWLWVATMCLEDTRIAYKNYLTGSQLPMRASIIEIFIMFTFLVVFFAVRILGSWNEHDLIGHLGLDRIFVAKAILCVYLLYFYYRTLFIFLPISHQLGPMLVRMKLMVKHDFMIYLRLFLISMTAGGIALNAILYPFHPINYDLMKRVLLFRGFMQLFAADKLDLERSTDDCRHSNLSHRISGPYTCVNLARGADFQ